MTSRRPCAGCCGSSRRWMAGPAPEGRGEAMGEVVGAGLVSHVPPIVMPEADRRALNGGRDISLVAGLHQLWTECLDRLFLDTVIVFDIHWFTTFEHVVAAHDHRAGLYTSEELPRTIV